ncbi:MAG: D-alanine--D-alanine ligase [Candidatus Sumerlaeota bacterium]|nr:D-alanine--D-alanine ligase [Candidatus Sumerlaeota bacterium]
MSDSRRPIWLICGGQTPEHEVSFASGRMAAANIDFARYALTPVYIRPDGRWAIAAEPFPPGATKEKVDAHFARFRAAGSGASAAGGARVHAAGEAVSLARTRGVQAVLLILHGPFGEDGTIQGLLEMEGLSYAGSGVLASALAMDKARCQRHLNGCGLPVAPFLAAEGPFGPEALDRAVRLARREIGLPCVVKPSRGGSSVGITIVREEARLPAAIQEAAAIDPSVLIERFCEGEEVTCGVLEFPENGRLVCQPMPVTAIRPKNSAFFDYQAKYTPGECDEITPAPIAAEDTRRVQALSVEAFEALGCRDMARVDFILTRRGPVVLEVNTIPGMTATSLLPQGAAHYGISFPQLLELLIQNALARAAS